MRFLALLLFALPVAAQECNYEGSVREMNACAVADYKQSFSNYTEIFQEKWRSHPPERKKQLVSSSVFWANAVRKQCLKTSRDSGDDETILFYTCLEQALIIRKGMLLRAD